VPWNQSVLPVLHGALARGGHAERPRVLTSVTDERPGREVAIVRGESGSCCDTVGGAWTRRCRLCDVARFFGVALRLDHLRWGRSPSLRHAGPVALS
jgi:hypothetical protein